MGSTLSVYTYPAISAHLLKVCTILPREQVELLRGRQANADPCGQEKRPESKDPGLEYQRGIDQLD